MRPSGAMPESKEITLMPRSIAFLATGTSASASLAEMTMASTFWAIRVLMISIWPSAVALLGPVEDDLDVAAEFLGGFLAPVAAGVEEAVAEVLDDHGDAHALRRRHPEGSASLGGACLFGPAREQQAGRGQEEGGEQGDAGGSFLLSYHGAPCPENAYRASRAMYGRASGNVKEERFARGA